MLGRRWVSISDAGPTSTQHWTCIAKGQLPDEYFPIQSLPPDNYAEGRASDTLNGMSSQCIVVAD